MILLNLTIAAKDKEALERAVNRTTFLVNEVGATKGKQSSNEQCPDFSFEFKIEEQ